MAKMWLALALCLKHNFITGCAGKSCSYCNCLMFIDFSVEKKVLRVKFYSQWHWCILQYFVVSSHSCCERGDTTVRHSYPDYRKIYRKAHQRSSSPCTLIPENCTDCWKKKKKWKKKNNEKRKKKTLKVIPGFHGVNKASLLPGWL